MGSLSIWHWVIVGAVAMALFAPARFVKNMRETGKTVRRVKEAGDDR